MRVWSGPSLYLTLQINSQQADCTGDCSFAFLEAVTPQVNSLSPDNVSGPSTSLVILGSKFTNDKPSVRVTVGEVLCAVTSAADGEIHCDVGYVPVGARQVVVSIAGKGNAHFNTINTVTSSSDIESVTPSVGSTVGGQTVRIVGNGFVNGSAVVKIDGQECDVESVSLSEIRCTTRPHDVGLAVLIVTSDGEEYPAESYEYSVAATPVVTSVSPGIGQLVLFGYCF